MKDMMFGAGGRGAMNPDPSLDLPAALQGLLGSNSPQVRVDSGGIAPLGGTPVAPNPSAPVLDLYGQPTFAEGGMVDPTLPNMGGGAGLMPQMAQMAPVAGVPMGVGIASPQAEALTEEDIQEFMQRQPQAVQQIASQMQAMIQTGEISLDQLNMAEQLAMVAIQNPQMYPQLRQYAVKRGLVDEQDISPSYDQGLLFAVVLAARAVRAGGVQMPVDMPAMPEMQNFAEGGFVTPGTSAKQGGYAVGPGTGTSDSIPIRVSAGEYIIPAHIVQMKGKEFFDAMLEKYRK